jgi:hypothetical protein
VSRTSHSRRERSSSTVRPDGVDAVAARRLSRSAVAVFAATLLVLVFFDLRTNLAFADEWLYRWSVEWLAAGHGLHFWPGALPLGLIQIAAALPLAVLHVDAAVLRLSVLPFVCLEAWMLRQIALGLGARSEWATVSAIAVVCSPVALSVASALNTDPAYLGLLATAMFFGVRWVQSGRQMPLAIVFAVIATLERQQGLTIAVGIGAGLLFVRGERQVRRREWLGLAALWLSVTVPIASPFLVGLASSTMTNLSAGRGALHPSGAVAMGAMVELAPMLGLVLLPLAMALLRRPDSERHRQGRQEMIAVFVAVAGLAGCVAFIFWFGTSIFPGNVFGVWGLGPTYIPGSKPALMPVAVYRAFELLCIGSFCVLLVWRRRAWTVSALGAAGVALVVTALAHIPLMIFTSPLDRYFLPIVALAAPVVAKMVSIDAAVPAVARTARVAPWAAMVLLIAGIVYYAVAQHDYQAWQAARDEAARMAYAQAPADQVDAGYEATATYVGIPSFESTGRTTIDPITMVPPHPLLQLRFAAADDPRPGVDYRSLAPGRIVIVAASGR